MKLSVIGSRGFPSSFVGTSGLEVYVENVIFNMIHLRKDLNVRIYVKDGYQKKLNNKHNRIELIPLGAVKSKTFETLTYSLVASIRASFDDSKVVWFHGVGASFFAFLPKFFGKKIFITVHSLDWNRRKWSYLEKNIFYSLALFVFRYSATFLAVSKTIKKTLKSNFRVDSIYTPPGIIKNILKHAVKNISVKNNEKYILYLGRIVPEKRLELLLAAFIKIVKNIPDLKLLIAGGHGNMPDYEKRLKKSFRYKNIIWLGSVFGKKKTKLISNSLGLILPSELEGNPISIYEALSLRKRCLVSDSIYSDLPNTGNIYKFKDGNMQSLKKNIQKIIDIKNRFYSYSNDEKKELLKFDWENTAKIIIREITS